MPVAPTVRGFVGSLMVLVGGLLIAALPDSTALMRTSLLPAMRASEAGRMLGLTIVMLGLGLLAAAWLTLCREVARARGADRDDALALVRHTLCVWVAPLVLAPPLFSRDGWSYAAQGMLAHLRISPYEHGPAVLLGPVVEAVDPMWLTTPTPYGPLPVWLGSVGAGLTGNPWLLVIGHRCVALVGLVLLAWAVPRLASWSRLDPALASAVTLASPLMITNGVAGLHNDVLMVGLMAAALVLAAERGWLLGAAVGGLAAAVKAPGGLVCVGVVLLSLPAAVSWRERWVRVAAVGAVSVGVLLGLGVVTGLGSGWLHALSVPGSLETPLSLTTLLGGLVDQVSLLHRLGTGLALVIAAWVVLRWPPGDRAAALRAVAVVMGSVVLLSPVVHLWYLLWVTPFLATVPLPRAGRVGLLAGSLVLGLAAPLDSSLHGLYLAILLGASLAAGLAGLLLLTRRSRLRLTHIVSAEWTPA